MGIKTFVNGFEKFIHPLSNLLLTIATCTLAAMMFLTATDVALRYVFNSPIPGALEIVEYMMGILIPFALVYTARQRAHIGVDLVIEHFSDRVRKIISIVTVFMTFVLFVLITWQGYYYIIEHYDSNLTSSVLYIPVWPFIILFTVGMAALTLVLLAEFLGSLSEVNS
ncbi:MAG: TRAP transporter small permease [Deltaproteobacteria bacterium]|nr:TRAP transporter small permease [Deltaproteobacteria bacterium]